MEDNNTPKRQHQTQHSDNIGNGDCPDESLSPQSERQFEYQMELVSNILSLSQSQTSPTIKPENGITCTPNKILTCNSRHINTKSGGRFYPTFLHALKHLSSPLAPLVSITTGLPHPDFPRTLLAYHLLTSSQLDDIARHYHQVWPPLPETSGYPIQVRAWVGTRREGELDIETKRRRLGRFMGLRGCESPVGDGDAGNWDLGRFESESEDEIRQRMEREWQAALLCARSQDSDEMLRRKAGGV